AAEGERVSGRRGRHSLSERPVARPGRGAPSMITEQRHTPDECGSGGRRMRRTFSPQQVFILCPLLLILTGLPSSGGDKLVRERAVLRGHTDYVVSVAFSPD